MKKWTVLLLYPVYTWDNNECPQSYINHTEAENDIEAIINVQMMAVRDNDGDFDKDEFMVAGIFRGHIDAQRTASDF